MAKGNLVMESRAERYCESGDPLTQLQQFFDYVAFMVMVRGELPRAGTGERQAGRVASALLEQGVLISPSTRAPLRLAFPATLASRWMPGLFPEKAESPLQPVTLRSLTRGRFILGVRHRLMRRHSFALRSFDSPLKLRYELLA